MCTKPDRLVIIASSDLHGNLTGFDYKDNVLLPNGMARLYTYVEKIRAEYEAVLLIDAGDMISGSVMLNELCAKHPDAPHPVMESMNLMGYDAAVLGNHDFDFGVPTMQKILRQAKFPLLAANVRDSQGNLLTGKGYAILECCGIKVAVIGVVMPFVGVTAGAKEGVGALTFLPGAETVRDVLSEIRGNYDVCLVSAHMSGYGEFDPEQGSDSAWHIAALNPEIHILHMAHSHMIDIGKHGATVFGEVRDKAREVLRFDVWFNAGGAVDRCDVRTVDLADYSPSECIAKHPLISELHQKTLEYLSGKGKQTDDSPVIGYAAKTFQPENAEKGKPIARFRETPLTNLINRVQTEASGADVSVCSLSDPDCNLKEGNITQLDLEKIYPFPNYLVKVPITGKELKKYLEWNAKCFEISERTGEVELNKDFPPYLQDFFYGIEFDIHPKNEKGKRIQNLSLHGTPLSDTQLLHLAVSNYRLNTTLKKEGMIAAEKEWQSEQTVRELLEEYISQHSPMMPELSGNWKIIL